MRILALSTAVAASLAGASPVGAVANANAINWTGSPAAFITSLYLGVLGRPPEAGNLGGWPGMVTGNPSSRLTVFNHFINSPEHRGYSHSRGPAVYAVYYRAQGNRWQYMVSKHQQGWFAKTGYMPFAEATARRDYYQTFEARR